ncbi:hypothetical protein RIF29_38043 [Crotalaria pallida]|uniref:Uncharacterized protein n=1 Tax=Crotalaria pallida TaxID=3830 RepID=A0AAN9E0Y8_CROPI
MQKNRESPRDKHRQVEKNRRRSTKGESERNEAPSQTVDSSKRDKPPTEERNGTEREEKMGATNHQGRNRMREREREREREKPNGSDEPPMEETNGTEKEGPSVTDERERGTQWERERERERKDGYGKGALLRVKERNRLREICFRVREREPEKRRKPNEEGREEGITRFKL